jgi:protein-disulfide isomerase
MFCIVSFVVLSILGIFSASNRELAREALDCVLRRVTLRPCTTGFDEKMKAKILGVVIIRSEKGARFLNKYFEVLAWIFFILLLASSIWTIRGLYLYYTTGSCEGLNSTNFCVFDPAGSNNQTSSGQGCASSPASEDTLSLKGVNLSGLPALNPTAQDKIVMIGCYHCDYTRPTYPIIRKLVDRYHVSFTFFNYPVKETSDYFTNLSYCVNQQSPDKFWRFNDAMFTGDKKQLDDPTYVNNLLTGLGINTGLVQFCTSDPQTVAAVTAQKREMQKTKFYGTPTIFINGKAYVGPKPERVYTIGLEGLFFWLK